MTRVLIAGVSTRAAAASAARAGFDAIALDGYADRDQDPRVAALSLPREGGIAFTAAAAAVAALRITADAAVYLSNFENDPAAVATLATGRALWGNSPNVLHRARDPFVVAAMFRAHGLPTPLLRTDPNENDPNVPNDPNNWLLKPFSSGGGRNIRPWDGRRVPRGWYLQQRIAGVPGSVVFAAAAGRAVPLGVSRQLIGDERFGASRFRYCGSILAPANDAQFTPGDRLVRAAHALADAAAAGLQLAGVNGIDFVARGDVPFPVEINPRWSASMELVERACGVNVFAAHAAACTTAELDVAPLPPRHAVGKAIVFARHPAIIGNTDRWLSDPDVRDVPHQGETISADSPVCTVFAEASDAAACEAALVARAGSIYTDLARWQAASASPVPPITNHKSQITNE